MNEDILEINSFREILVVLVFVFSYLLLGKIVKTDLLTEILYFMPLHIMQLSVE